MAVGGDDDIISAQHVPGDETPGQLAEDMGISPADAPLGAGDKVIGPQQPENDKCTYTWVVENFLRIRLLKYHSPVFYSGPHAWRLLMFPQGNNCGMLSVYLDVADGMQLPQHWSRQAHFSLTVRNHLDPSRAVTKESDHVFHSRANDWGFREFVPLKDVRDPAAGFISSSGALIIDCAVEVTWQPQQHFDAKKETGFVGLKNQGATCYMNSLLQTLEHIPFFRKAVYHMPTKEDEDAENSIPLALQRIFYKLQHSDTSVSTKQLTKSFGWDASDTFMQHDVQELNRVLVDKLEEKMKGTSVEGTMAHLFEGKLTNIVKCVNVEDESRREEAFYDLQLTVKGRKNIYEALDEYVREELLDGENQYMSDKFGKQDAKKGVRFKSLPPVLQLHLLRFEFDFATEQMVKVNSRFEFPEWLDLDRDDRRYLTDDSDPNTRNYYKLHSVLVHSGGPNGGHYYVYVKPFGAEHANKWYKFDDERVTCVSAAEATEGAYGDDSSAETRAGALTPGVGGYYRGGGPKVSSAYMLVYIRESAIPELNCEVGDSDIVPHLRAQLEREQLDKMRKRKERNEAHLYTVMKVATEADLRAQIGESSFFDLVDHDKVARFRIKKEESIAELKRLLEGELGVPAYKQRLWLWVHRQNKTFRPDKPLQAEYADEMTPVMDVKEDVPAAPAYARVQAEVRLYLEVVADAQPPAPPAGAACGAAGAAAAPPFATPGEYADQYGVTGVAPLAPAGGPPFEPMDADLPPAYPLLRATDIFLFVKFFDPVEQSLSFLGTHLARSTDRLSNLLPVLRALRGLGEAVQLDVFEEVEFEAQVLFTRIREDRTLREAELQHGDILVFQTLPIPPPPGGAAADGAAPMSVDASPGAAEPAPIGGFDPAAAAVPMTIPTFFDSVKNRVTVHLFKLPQVSEQANIREREPPIKLQMDKRMSYDDVVAAVGRAVGCNPAHVRLTLHNCYTEQPKPQPLKYRGAAQLLDMLMSFQKTSDTLYYEVLDIPLVEFDSKKSLKVSWHNQQCEETKALNLLLAKETTVGQALEMIAQQVELELPTHDSSGAPYPVSKRLRMLELFTARIYKVFGYDELIETINDQYWTIRAEEVPLEERGMGADDKLVHVRHFHNDVKLSMINNFGDPFLLMLTPTDTQASVRRRIASRLRMSDEDFAQYKIATINVGRVAYLDDAEPVLARFRTQDTAPAGNFEDYLGIEHPSPPAGPQARKRLHSRYHDKPIKIYG